MVYLQMSKLDVFCFVLFFSTTGLLASYIPVMCNPQCFQLAHCAIPPFNAQPDMAKRRGHFSGAY